MVAMVTLEAEPGAGRAGAGAAQDRPSVGRRRLRDLLLLASMAVAAGVILVQIGDPSRVWEVASEAEWGWLVAALALSLATNISYAVALKGTLPIHIPLWPAAEVQLAMSFSNLVIPVVGGAGLQIRFLQRRGANLPAAVAAGGILSAAGTVLTQLPMFLAGIWLSPRVIRLGGFSVSGMLEMFGLGLAGAAALVTASALLPRFRRVVVAFGRGMVTTVWTAVRTPRQLVLIVAGNAATGLMGGLSLWLCLYAFGVSIPFLTVMAANMGVSCLAALVPVPGAGSGAGAIGLTAVLVGLGVHAPVAVSATLAGQIVGTYLPALAGWVATRHLISHRLV